MAFNFAYAAYSLYGYLDFMRTIRYHIFLRSQNGLFDEEFMKEDFRIEGWKFLYEEIYNKLQKYMQGKTNFILKVYCK